MFVWSFRPFFQEGTVIMYDVSKIWPKWKINRTIGEGSFGKVYEISRNEYGIEEHSALKIISIPQSDGEIQSLKSEGMNDIDTTEYFKGIVNDFIQEIQLMTKLKGSSNIVAYEDFAVVEKTGSIGFDILIRMELLTGLPSYLRENRFRVYDVIQLGIDMCKALEVCRDLNIVHRDIKPDNIFVSSTGKFKLGDFGVARTIEKTMAGLSRKGTYSYMAPEIYNGNEYGFEADIYSLGIVLYKLLNNNRDPFLPQYPNAVKYSDKMDAMVKRIQGLEMPLPVNADEKLAQIIFKACAHNPLERYSHPKDLRDDLESIALRYVELQSEVFSVAGINYYTNDLLVSVELTGDSSAKSVSVAEKATAITDQAVNNSVNDEATGVVEDEVTCIENDDKVAPVELEDEGTMVLFDNHEESDLNKKEEAPKNIIYAQKISQPKPMQKEALKCPVCNNIIKSGNKFCGHCGNNLEAKKVPATVCPRCGFSMKPGVKFCGKCGFKF